MNRRLLFVKQRMTETTVEHRWMAGKLADLPVGMVKPPEWAQLAYKGAWKHGFSHVFGNLTDETVRKDPRGCLSELRGIYESLLAYVERPTADQAKDEKAVPALRELREKVRKGGVGKPFLGHLKNLDERLDKLLPPLDQQRVIELGERFTKGARATYGDGELLGLRSTTAKIFYLVWLCWPAIAKKKRFQSADFHEWLAGDFGIFASEKLVESIHTNLRIAEFWEAPST